MTRPLEAGRRDDQSGLHADRATEHLRVTSALDGDLLARPEGGRLAELADRFGFSTFDRDCVATLWAIAFDPSLHAELCARDPAQHQTTPLVVAELFEHPARVRLAGDSPLLAWDMVREIDLASGGAALLLDTTVLAWLEGEHRLDRALGRQAELLPLGPELLEWAIDSVVAEAGARLREGGKVRLHVHTEDALAARWFAAAVGRRLGLAVLDVSSVDSPPDSDLAMRVQRQAFLDNCIPLFAGGQTGMTCPAGIGAFPVQIVHGPAASLAARLDIHDLDIALPTPGPDERERLWRRFLPASAGWVTGALRDLAFQHEAEAGEIATVAAQHPSDATDAARMLRRRSRSDAVPMTRRADAAFVWADLLVAPPVRARLEEFSFEARERMRLWAEPDAARLFPYGRGLVGLFAGPPGTGKTMAAQVIAAELGMDLLAVDLSAVVSKWVGETAEHLQQLFSARSSTRSILFFDEADALYAKRVEDVRDAQDRFANFDTSHLMTALEAYPGIVILATNLRANIDSAFLRRIRHIIEFAKPGPDEREAIWSAVIDALFPRSQARKLRPALVRVARIEASGAVIKNAALSALFAARRRGLPPTVDLLADMLSRELSKEGESLTHRDLAAMLEPGA